MNTKRISRSGAAAAVVAALLAATPAAAQLGEDAVACRAAIAKNWSKLLKTGNKTIASCHKSRDGGKVPNTTDCNDMTAADSKSKFSGGVTKAVAAIQAACGSSSNVLTADPLNFGKQWYVSCPVTTGACMTLPNPILTMNDVATCLGCLAEDIAEQVASDTMGLPVVDDLLPEEAKCHGAIAKGFGKYFSTRYKSETACQGDDDEAGDNDIDSCSGDDAKGKVAKSLTKAQEGIDKACGTTNVPDLDSCAMDLVNLKVCVEDEWQAAAEDAFESTYQLEGTECPTVVRTTIRGGCSTLEEAAGACVSGGETDTELSVGWKGVGHHIDIADAYTLAGDVVCPGTAAGSCAPANVCGGGNPADSTFGDVCASNGDCADGNTCGGGCTVTGISYDNPQYQDFSRCETNPATLCDEPFGPDEQCGVGACQGGPTPAAPCLDDATCGMGGQCGGIECIYFLGPPLALQSAGTPTCTLNLMSTDISGTGNPDSGDSQLLVNLRAKVHSGDTLTRPCPVCEGDTTPQDGVRDGTCLATDPSINGDPCDIQAFDLTFAPTNADSPTRGPSLDCAPAVGANVSGSGLKIPLPLGTGTVSKDAVDDCDTMGSLDCFCGVCSHDTTTSCNSDDECDLLDNAALDTSSSCNTSGGTDRYPNECTSNSYVCSVSMGQTDTGVCASSFLTYCNGVLTSKGEGIIPCSSNAACTSASMTPGICPGNNCGTCGGAGATEQKSCFLDPIVTSGTPDVENPTLVGLFCVPPTGAGAINAAAGTPGPGGVKTDSIVEKRFH